MTRRSFRLVQLLATVALASSAGAQGARPSVILPGYRGVVYLDTVGTIRPYAAPRARVLAALEGAFAELGVSVQADEARGLVGNLQIKTQRRLAGTPLSRLLDCGVRDKGPNADFYRVNMALMGMVRTLADSTQEVRIALAAGAQDFAGPLADPIACGSTGKLEERMHAFVATQLAGK